MQSVENTPSVYSLLILSYTVCYTTICMAQIQSKIQELRDELYDVVNELCNQMKLLRNELLELQHAIHNLEDTLR